MKKIAIITHIPFWQAGAGHCTRIYTLVCFLCKYTELTVIYGGLITDEDTQRLRALPDRVDLKILQTEKYNDYRHYLPLFRDLITQQKFDAYIIEFIELSFLIDLIPPGSIILLDAHDIVSERNKSFATLNAKPYQLLGQEVPAIDEERELELFRRYDAIIAINKRDAELLSQLKGLNDVIMAPHPPALVKRNDVNEQVANIGFVASGYAPNVDGILNFIRQVWTFYPRKTETLNIYGSVGHHIPVNLLNDSIIIHGMIPQISEIYNGMDIAINPVRMGAGLKIKNMEALGFGIPLVTTTHGSSGIEDGKDDCFMVADSPNEFINALSELSANKLLRKRLAHHSYAYVMNNFNDQKCFRELLNYLNSLR